MIMRTSTFPRSILLAALHYSLSAMELAEGSKPDQKRGRVITHPMRVQVSVPCLNNCFALGSALQDGPTLMSHDINLQEGSFPLPINFEILPHKRCICAHLNLGLQEIADAIAASLQPMVEETVATICATDASCPIYVQDLACLWPRSSCAG